MSTPDFTERVTPATPEPAPEFTPEPVPPVTAVAAQTWPEVPPQPGTASPGNRSPEVPQPSSKPAPAEALYQRQADGSFTAVTVNADPNAPAEMPTYNYYVHTADGSVFKVMDAPTGPRYTDDEDVSHLVIGVYPR